MPRRRPRTRRHRRSSSRRRRCARGSDRRGSGRRCLGRRRRSSGHESDAPDGGWSPIGVPCLHPRARRPPSQSGMTPRRLRVMSHGRSLRACGIIDSVRPPSLSRHHDAPRRRSHHRRRQQRRRRRRCASIRSSCASGSSCWPWPAASASRCTSASGGSCRGPTASNVPGTVAEPVRTPRPRARRRAPTGGHRPHRRGHGAAVPQRRAVVQRRRRVAGHARGVRRGGAVGTVRRRRARPADAGRRPSAAGGDRRSARRAPTGHRRHAGVRWHRRVPRGQRRARRGAPGRAGGRGDDRRARGDPRAVDPAARVASSGRSDESASDPRNAPRWPRTCTTRCCRRSR